MKGATHHRLLRGLAAIGFAWEDQKLFGFHSTFAAS
jgi:hypothetical protein